MKLSNETLNSGFQAVDWENQIIEKEVDQYIHISGAINKVKIQIKFTSNQQIIYQKNGETLRVVQVHDVLENPEIFNNMDQIQNLQWEGRYNKNKKKEGKWIASWKNNILKNVGGYYNNGQKQGLWNDLFINYCDQTKVLETGEYYNNLRVGNWYYICKDKKIGGGLYNNFGQKQGKWIELEEGFYEEFHFYAQAKYNVEYNKKSMRIGIQDILYVFCSQGTKGREYNYKQIGVGLYHQEGQKKVGKWVCFDERFSTNKCVTHKGKYNKNGLKVGRWDIMHLELYSNENKQIGGGSYDQDGNQKKIGKWIEKDKNFTGKLVIYNGEYDSRGMKVDKWDILQDKYGSGQYKSIGGGSYDLEGYQIKIGMWIEPDEGFHSNKQVTFHGEYNIKEVKVGKWDIKYCRNSEKEYQQLGGGSYDQEGSKIGYWVELDEGFFDSSKVIWNGEYLKGMKIGKWNVMYCNQNEYKQIGEGQYDQEGNQKKIGKWVEPINQFYVYKQITYNGEYNMNGIKVGRWDIMYCSNNKEEYEQIGGGSYDQEGNQQKVGEWVELVEGFNQYKKVTYYGQYNMNSMKVGRWDTWFDNEGNKKIGGGSYDYTGNQRKIGQWIELIEDFYDGKQITYNGEYNVNGMKVGRWDVMLCKKGENQFKTIGYGSYDQEGNQNKIGKWIEVIIEFYSQRKVALTGEYNLNGIKTGLWDEMEIQTK